MVILSLAMLFSETMISNMMTIQKYVGIATDYLGLPESLESSTVFHPPRPWPVFGDAS